MASYLCFCGCGEDRVKYDPTNIDGMLVTIELGHWLRWRTVMDEAGGPNADADATSDADQFLDDGKVIYRRLIDEAHRGMKRRRKERKLGDKWVKFSKESRGKISAYTAMEGIPDPFELPMANPLEVRAWVDEGKLPEVELQAED